MAFIKSQFSSAGIGHLPRGSFALAVTLALLVVLLVVEWSERRSVAALHARMEEFYVKPTLQTRAALTQRYARLNTLAVEQGHRKEFDLARFHGLAQSTLENDPAVLVVAWLPCVPSVESRFDTGSESEPPSLLIRPPTSCWQRMCLTPPRDQFPVYYLQARAEFMELWGVDLGSVESFRTAIEKARDAGKPITVRATDIALLAEVSDAYAVFAPVYHTTVVPDSVEGRRQELRGFCAEIFRFDARDSQSRKVAWLR